MLRFAGGDTSGDARRTDEEREGSDCSSAGRRKPCRFWPGARRVDPGKLRTGNRTTGSYLSLGFCRRGGRENSGVLWIQRCVAARKPYQAEESASGRREANLTVPNHRELD